MADTVAEKKKDIPEKGAILQRDGESYAVALRMPAGIVTPDQLRRIADVSEKYNAAALKISSSQRLVIVGLKEEDIDNVWADLDMEPGAAIGMCVRSVRICPGTTFCKRAKQDSVSLGLKLESMFHGKPLPCKMKIGVSGCPFSCAEPAVRDIGFAGDAKGFKLYVGGNASNSPQVGTLVAEGLNEEQAVEITGKIIDFVIRKDSKKRLGRLIDEIGIDTFKAEVGLN
ncbi:NAD(P)/FAD-dependent oxidoreductase [Methanosarcinaceae archaeon]|nr:NAD(P)/FAD-dependent oxidoreductase [Methanosarcinaceae archaeon]MBQ3620192.1 NAD(P)/FAD-dependent oxidoreductase [Methanosarcinaceae archaeon]